MRAAVIIVTLAICVPITSLASLDALAANDPAFVREQKMVVVDGKPETWRLQWDTKPMPACGAEQADISLTCPCSGFAYGEEAPLALVRIRADGKIERLELGPLFEQGKPVGDEQAARAVLQRWAPIEANMPDNDWQHLADVGFAARVARRPPVDVMKLADFDHDGEATEFLLQVSTLPCGKHQMVLVGISKVNPHLHVFSSADDPQKPLVLASWEWHALRDSAGPVDVIDWHCGDHGSDQQWKAHLSAKAGVIHVTKSSRACPDLRKSEAYKKLLKLNDMYEHKEIPYDQFIKRKMELIKELPDDPQ